VAFIDSHRDWVTDGLVWGVEPICRVLQFAPSTYYAAKCRPVSARAAADAVLKPLVLAVFEENFEVYGMEKLWIELRRRGVAVGRDRVARLMRELGIAGVRRGRKKITTIPAHVDRPADLVKRRFTAPAPNRLWVADLTYVPTVRGFAYTAFVTDAFSRRIVGWAVSNSLRSELALDALEMAIFDRQRHGDLAGLIHHSDRGVQYLDVRYTERLGQSQVINSVGSKGDSYDNALAESVNSLYKAELIGPEHWDSIAEVELATGIWVHWWNHQRLHSACGFTPPAEYEAAWAAAQSSTSA
jgi:putative transposase